MLVLNNSIVFNMLRMNSVYKIKLIVYFVIPVLLLSCTKENPDTEEYQFGKVPRTAISQMPENWSTESGALMMYDLSGRYVHIHYLDSVENDYRAIVVDLQDGTTWGAYYVRDVLTGLNVTATGARGTSAMRINGNTMEWITKNQKGTCILSNDPNGEMPEASFTSLEIYNNSNIGDLSYSPDPDNLFQLSFEGYIDVAKGRVVNFDWSNYTEEISVPRGNGFMVAAIENITGTVVLFQQELNGDREELNRLEIKNGEGGYQIIRLENDAVYARTIYSNDCYRLPADGSDSTLLAEEECMLESFPEGTWKFPNGVCVERQPGTNGWLYGYKFYHCDEPGVSIEENCWLGIDQFAGQPNAAVYGLLGLDYYDPVIFTPAGNDESEKSLINVAVVDSNLQIHPVKEKSLYRVGPITKNGFLTWQNAAAIDFEGVIYRIDAPF